LESQANIPSVSADHIDFNKLKIIIRNNWLWILLMFLLVNTGVYLVIRYTKNVYQSESELKLDVKTNATELGIRNIVEDQNLNIVSGEIEIIESKLFLNRVLDYSDFEIGFYSVGHVLNDELFRRSPALFSYHNRNHSLYNTPITFEEISPTEFLLQKPGGPEVRGQYGSKVLIDDLELTLERNADYKKGDEIGYFFIIHSREVLLDYLSTNLTAEPLNFNANTIRITFKDNNAFKAQAVLHKIDTLYLQYSNEQKNQANKQKIDWLSNELKQIEQKIEDYEDYFETFTLENKTNDLDEDLKQIIKSINNVDSQRYDFTRRLVLLNNLIDGLSKGEPLVSISLRAYLPQSMIQRLDELQQLQLEQDRLRLSYNEVTFAYQQKQKQIETARTKSVQQLGGLKTDWQKRVSELNQRKASLEKEFASMPDKNTEFTKNQRFYKLYEEFYLTLMKSKSEFEIAQAGSIPDFKILSPATLPEKPISPNKLMITGIGLVASLVLTFFLVAILYLANNRITNVQELERIVSAPVLGAVPQSKHLNGVLHILDQPKSMVSEAIRTLRTNLDFFQASSNNKVIAISSTVSGEGKSFIAMNLGGVLALSKKKVVLLDLDMRKAKTGLPGANDLTKGISTILIKRNTWADCLTKTPLENFDFIPSGPHPPNPSELLMNGEFADLISDLKQHYDFILLDTPPVGLVTDGIMAMKRADMSIYVFRANYSKKEFLFNLKRIITINKFSNIATILNALPVSGKTYGYGYYEDNGSSRNLMSMFKS
jgi:tyrosine-protein kinase Etk/Wzc